jgi:hypothetical protein
MFEKYYLSRVKVKKNLLLDLIVFLDAVAKV